TGALLLSASVPFLERLVSRSGPGDVYAELRPGKERHAVLAGARRIGVLPLVTNAAMFANAEDWARHRLLCAIGRNSTVSEIETEGRDGGTTGRSSLPPSRLPVFPPDAWLKPVPELS